MIQQGKNPREFDFIWNESNLKFNWGIICPDDFFSKNPEKRNFNLEAMQIYDQMREYSTLSARIETGVKMPPLRPWAPCWINFLSVFMRKKSDLILIYLLDLR